MGDRHERDFWLSLLMPLAARFSIRVRLGWRLQLELEDMDHRS